MADTNAHQAVDFLRRIEVGEESPLDSVGIESMVSAARTQPVTGFDELPDRHKQAVEGALGKLRVPGTMTVDEEIALEAIIIPDRRPAISIRNGDYTIAEQDWLHLNAEPIRRNVCKAIPAIGRVELPDHPSLPYGGTAWLVAPDLVMTNRHVAMLFATGLGRNGLRFVPGSAAMNFVAEEGRIGDDRFAVEKVALIHPYWDMALLRVKGIDPTVAPLVLTRDAGAIDGKRDVVVIGYPAFDPRNNAELQRRLFNDVFNVKRLRPGKLLPRRAVRSYDKMVEALTHDSSTLGGDSGGVVLLPDTGQVVALHFGGRYLETNYAVPVEELACDARLVDLGLNFEAGVPTRPLGGPWESYWQAVDAPAASSERPAPAAVETGQAVTIDVPITVSVRIDPARIGGAAALVAAAGDVATEAMTEPWHDSAYRRAGYAADFLGPEIALPTPTQPGDLATLEDGSTVIPYTHFSVAMHRARRLALFTAANVRTDAAAKRPDPTQVYTRAALSGLREGDVEKWFLDERVRPMHQLPDRFFTKDRKAFDKGHLVRREDVAWGDSYEELRTANGDTYHVTNCSPQVAGFNRANGVVNWGELEKAVLRLAGVTRLSVFAGPLLRDDDPVFSGVDDVGVARVRIPRAYWKVVVVKEGDGLAAFGFLLEQDLAQVAMEAVAFDAKWAPQAVSLADLEQRIGVLTFPQVLHHADRHGSAGMAKVAATIGG